MGSNNRTFAPIIGITIKSIEGEPLAINGVRKRIKKLEAVVEPFVTARKTSADRQLMFGGKRQYLTESLLSLGEKNCHALYALQNLYQLEAAWEAGDLDRLVRATMGFVSLDAEYCRIDAFGVSGDYGAHSTAQRKRKSLGGLKTANERKRDRYDKLRKEAADRMKSEVPKHRYIKDAAREVLKSFSHLEEPPKIRFIELAHKELNNGAPR